MEHDSSLSGYHEPEPGAAGLEEEEDWGDDFPKTFSVNLIWAEAHDKEGHAGAIGVNGGMPWHLPEDLKHFTRPLPNRDNIVISRNPNYAAPGATVVGDLEAALDLARQEAIPDDGMDRSEIWIIGGAQLFNEALPQADKAYVTQIRADVEADTYAPDMDALLESGLWRVADTSPWLMPAKSEGGIRGFRYVTYRKTR